MSCPNGAGDTGAIAGLKCRDLTYGVSQQCRGCAGILIFRLDSRGTQRGLITNVEISMCICTSSVCRFLDSKFNTFTCQIQNLKT